MLNCNALYRTALWLITGLALTGCSAMTPGHPEAVAPMTTNPRVGNVYMFRGFIGVFSTGMDHLGEEVNALGVHGEVYQDDQWATLADHIATKFHGVSNPEPLVLIGHSYGADDIVRLARKLDDANVNVDLLITLDPVTPPLVPKNVKHCINLYESNGAWDNLPFLRGVPMKSEPGSTGQLVNSNIRTDRTDLLEPGLDHFNIEKKEKIHVEILRQVLDVCPTRSQWTAAKQSHPPIAAATPTTMPVVKAVVAPTTAPVASLARSVSARD